ncbi:MAG: glycerol kinase GlpK [Kordiimonas sp.]
MTAKQAILAMDQGTTSSRAIVFASDGSIVSVSQQEFPQIYPEDGWVEHDPEAIWKTSIETAQKAFADAEAKGFHVAAIGITNQRETTVVWDKETGVPIYNAIVWQDRRTETVCRALSARGFESVVQDKTGLLLDPYFSATKIAWILDNIDGVRQRAEKGEIAFGTIDCFLISRLTSGGAHVTDATNASRTSLFNIATQTWDEELLTAFDVPIEMLPKVKDSAANFGETVPELFGRSIPICGVAGDQQAATIGQCCFEVGDIKSTYGTGCFVLLNTGADLVKSKNRLLTTVAYRLDGKPTYALEGSIFVAGAAVQWLRDGISIIESAKETEMLAAAADPDSGVYMVPAFTGLGAPYWDANARAAVFGMTRATGRSELVRATLEAVCFQTADLFDAMASDGVKPSALKVDGGIVSNDWLVQFLAELLGFWAEWPVVMETTALGAAYLAGLQAGLFNSLEEIQEQWSLERKFFPEMDTKGREKLERWRKAVEATRSFSLE